MSLNLRLSKFINFLNVNSRTKHFNVKYKNNVLIKDILKTLKKEDLIYNFFIDDENYCNIFLKYNSLGEPIIKKIDILYKRPFMCYYNINQLKSKDFTQKYILKNGIFTSMCFFYTTKGILSYQDCLNFNIGGLLLLKIKC